MTPEHGPLLPRQHCRAIPHLVANMGPHYREMLKAYGDEVLPELRAGQADRLPRQSASEAVPSSPR